jgi:hypothetical protein
MVGEGGISDRPPPTPVDPPQSDAISCNSLQLLDGGCIPKQPMRVGSRLLGFGDGTGSRRPPRGSGEWGWAGWNTNFFGGIRWDLVGWVISSLKFRSLSVFAALRRDAGVLGVEFFGGYTPLDPVGSAWIVLSANELIVDS